MHQARRLRSRMPKERIHDHAVGTQPFAGDERGLDRLPGQLMAEGDRQVAADDHAGPLSLDEDSRITVRERLGEPALRSRGNDRESFQELSHGYRESPEACQDRIEDGGRDAYPTCRKHLGDEEGVSLRHPVNLCRLALRCRTQPTYRLHAQGRERHSAHGRADQASEELPQRMAGVDTGLAERQQERPGDSGEPSGEIADRVERRVICPVDVLHHHDRRMGRKDAQQRRQRVAEAIVRQGRRQF